MNTMHDCTCAHKSLVENQIGSAYAVVKEVREALPQLLVLAPQVVELGSIIDRLTAIEGRLAVLEAALQAP